jgi:hypothetical protein
MVQEQDRDPPKETVSPEWVRWVLAAIVAGMVSYFTTIATVQQQTLEVKTTEAAHFQEILRRLDAMQADVRELRDGRDR